LASSAQLSKESYIGKLLDKGGPLFKLRLKINKAARHFRCFGYRHLLSFATFGIPVGRSPYAIDGKCPGPHVAIPCREYLDFAAFVLEARHGI
jgi:hypothetical protein